MEAKVIKIDNDTVNIDGRMYKAVEPPKPEIKVGDWEFIETLKPGCMGLGDGIYRVVSKPTWKNPEFPSEGWHGLSNSDEGFFVIDDFDGRIWKIDAEVKRPATPAEIESHLKKVCEKYIGKRVRCLWKSDDIEVANNTLIYYPHDDHLIANANTDNKRIVLYHNGIFAEILPDKKKRPETKQEYDEFIGEYLRSELTRDEFLNRYDI